MATTVDPRPAPRTTAVPGEALLHPAAVAAVLVLVANDHLLKAHWGSRPHVGVVTGKLSDVVGLVFFPLLLVSLVEVGRWACGTGRKGHRSWPFRRTELVVMLVVTGAGFVAVQTVPWAAEAYSSALAVLRWLPDGLAALATGQSLPPLPAIRHIMDPTDALAVPALWLSWWIGQRVLCHRACTVPAGDSTASGASTGECDAVGRPVTPVDQLEESGT